MSQQTHTPDLSRIPKGLQRLDWLPMRADLIWSDGSRVLVAVPICQSKRDPTKGFYYEINVVTICCDEGYFSVELDDEPWGWELDDVDFYYVVS